MFTSQLRYIPPTAPMQTASFSGHPANCGGCQWLKGPREQPKTRCNQCMCKGIVVSSCLLPGFSCRSTELAWAVPMYFSTKSRLCRSQSRVSPINTHLHRVPTAKALTDFLHLMLPAHLCTNRNLPHPWDQQRNIERADCVLFTFLYPLSCHIYHFCHCTSTL
jgi:hypothetical protein